MDSYEVRFIRNEHIAELINLYHLARTALPGQHGCTAYDRRLWASKEFSLAHPEITPTAAYKDLCGLTGA